MASVCDHLTHHFCPVIRQEHVAQQNFPLRAARRDTDKEHQGLSKHLLEHSPADLQLYHTC